MSGGCQQWWQGFKIGTHPLHRAGLARLAVPAAKDLAEAAVAEPAGLILNQGRAVIPHGQLLSESSGFSMI